MNIPAIPIPINYSLLPILEFKILTPNEIRRDLYRRWLRSPERVLPATEVRFPCLILPPRTARALDRK